MAKQQEQRGRKRPPMGGPQRKRNCFFCKDKIDEVDYKNVNQLRRYISEKGKIRNRRITGACRRHQRQVAVAVKRLAYGIEDAFEHLGEVAVPVQVGHGHHEGPAARVGVSALHHVGVVVGHPLRDLRRGLEAVPGRPVDLHVEQIAAGPAVVLTAAVTGRAAGGQHGVVGQHQLHRHDPVVATPKQDWNGAAYGPPSVVVEA